MLLVHLFDILTYLQIYRGDSQNPLLQIKGFQPLFDHWNNTLIGFLSLLAKHTQILRFLFIVSFPNKMEGLLIV